MKYPECEDCYNQDSDICIECEDADCYEPDDGMDDEDMKVSIDLIIWQERLKEAA